MFQDLTERIEARDKSNQRMIEQLQVENKDLRIKSVCQEIELRKMVAMAEEHY